MQRKSAFPGQEAAGIISPKSSDLKSLVSYVLDDSSPHVKELEKHMKNMKLFVSLI
jgi:hypothetical protein